MAVSEPFAGRPGGLPSWALSALTTLIVAGVLAAFGNAYQTSIGMARIETHQEAMTERLDALSARLDSRGDVRGTLRMLEEQVRQLSNRIERLENRDAGSGQR